MEADYVLKITGCAPISRQPGNMSSIKSGITISTSIEMVPDRGWKNVFIKGLTVASSWGRPVQEDHDPSTLPGQLNSFSLDERKSQTRASSPQKDTQVLEAGSSKVAAKKDNARQALALGPTGYCGQRPLRSTFRTILLYTINKKSSNHLEEVQSQFKEVQMMNFLPKRIVLYRKAL